MTRMSPDNSPPILRDKHTCDDSIFLPENLLRESRRQRRLEPGDVPKICLLDPDGDIVRWLLATGQAEKSPYWACYHTELFTFETGGRRVGVIGNAVGAPFAVLLAEQLFVSGCTLLISITSAGGISTDLEPPCLVLIDKALRDEGTSYHYLPPAAFAKLSPVLLSSLNGVFAASSLSVVQGAAWTTDAPYRETAAAITAARARGVVAVEMEAAALYAFAEARDKAVICFAHITNQMARDGDDFEKGEANGVLESLAVFNAAVAALKL